MREYVVGDVFQDQLAASHPAAPVIVAPLAKAAGVLHSTPKLVVLPDDPALGEFRELYAGRVGTLRNSRCRLRTRIPASTRRPRLSRRTTS
jgi:hypothetical protein